LVRGLRVVCIGILLDWFDAYEKDNIERPALPIFRIFVSPQRHHLPSCNYSYQKAKDRIDLHTKKVRD